MASREIHVEISITETPQFRRLIDFIHDVEDYADEIEDVDLAEIIDRLRADLAGYRRLTSR